MGKGSYCFGTTPRRERTKRAAAERALDFREIYEPPTPQEIQEQAARCVGCGIPGCEPACPLGNAASLWMQLAADGDFEAAARLVYRTNPMPWATGRLCPAERLCEGGCVLRDGYGSATTQETERFVADAGFETVAEQIRAAIVPNHVRVAVAGSGPAGLACADFLSRFGYAVTVFEKRAEPGGILQHGLTAFKLERGLLPRYLRTLEARGVEIRCNTAVGEVAGGWRAAGFRALFLGLGAQRRLELPGMAPGAARNVLAASDHLAAAAAGAAESSGPIRGRRVLVLGGGDVALDCARTALRQGAREVVCAFRESEPLRPGSRRELALAIEEGVRIVGEVSPVRFVSAQSGDVSGVELAGVHCRRPASGVLQFEPRAGAGLTLEADVVIVSLGFLPDPPPLVREEEIETDAQGRIIVDCSQRTSAAEVFAGGDAVRGPSLVAFGLRDGREAAFAIDRTLREAAG